MGLSMGIFFLSLSFFLFFFLDFINLFVRERERASTAGGAAEGEGEAGSPLSKEPNARLDPRTLESGPEAKADA